MVTRFTKVGGGVTAHSHVRLQFRYLGNRSALTLKPHHLSTNRLISFGLARSSPNMASYWLRATYKAERVYLQLAEIFHIERPGPARP